MAEQRALKQLTKKDFLERVQHGTLSTDQVLAKLLTQLQQFEQKYGMRSEVFQALIVGTPAEDQPDFTQWAMCYRSYFRTLQTKFPLKEFADVVGRS